LSDATLTKSYEFPVPFDISRATPLQKEILRTILYFDIFRHPLTADEIYQFLPSNSTNPDEIEDACSSKPLRGLLDRHGPFYFVKSRGPRVPLHRLEKEKEAQKLWRSAMHMGRIMKYIPFVQAIFVSGELSKGVASKGSDIDFLIVTTARRLWLCRFLFVVFKRLLPGKLRNSLCFNTFVSEDAFVYSYRNMYSAIEIATLKVLYNKAAHRKYVEANKWINNFLPNFRIQEQEFPVISERVPLIQKFYRLAFSGRIFDKLDERFMRLCKKLILWKFSDLSQEQQSKLFICTPTFFGGYSLDHERKILQTYRQKLHDLGVTVEIESA